MDYLEDIERSYADVCSGEALPDSPVDRVPVKVKMVLQYENWQNASPELQKIIKEHQCYSQIDASQDSPLRDARLAGNVILQPERSEQRLLSAYTLQCIPERYSTDSQKSSNLVEGLSSNGDILRVVEKYLEEKENIWCWSSKEEKEKEVAKLKNKSDLKHLISVLGLYHYHSIRKRYIGSFFVCLFLQSLIVTKPNIIDADLSFAFCQSGEDEPAKTRNLSTGGVGINEYLLTKTSSLEKEISGILVIQDEMQVDTTRFFQEHYHRLCKSHTTS